MSIEQDEATNDVIKWLHKKGEIVKRINVEDEINELSITINRTILRYKTVIGQYEEINLDKVSAFWYRRGNWPFKELAKDDDDWKIYENTGRFIKNENDTLRKYLHSYPFQKKLGDYYKKDAHKLLTLKIAKEVGFAIPEFLVTNNVNELNSFVESQKQAITKVLSNPINLYMPKQWLPMYTTEVNSKDFVKNIGISYLQNKINKKYELRIFHLNPDFYAAAIFSQANNRTVIDYRKYDYDRPNRMVPFNLPIHLINKLKRLVDKLQLTTCSIDIIVDDNDNYIFLEVNPIGQFGDISYNCNYYLENKIANYLSK
ncbi:grasp-with-spasm system ATP-grasp peptide maturase [Salinivirga cyanobacteriivorans]